MLPKYEQIATDLRGRIVRGELRPGDALPSEAELMRQWGVARATLVKGLSILAQEGLIEARQGSGRFVLDRMALARTAGERYQTSLTTGHIYTSGEHASILSADLSPAPEDVATALGVEPGEQVARRQRVTYEGTRPVATSTSWFTAEVATAAPRLLQAERIREGTTRYVETQTGRSPHTGRDWTTARLATAEERELLSLENPAAVSEQRHVAFDAEGLPLTYEVGVHPGGRWTRTDTYSMRP